MVANIYCFPGSSKWIMRQQKLESKTIPITVIAEYMYTLQYWIDGWSKWWNVRPEMGWLKKKFVLKFLFLHMDHIISGYSQIILSFREDHCMIFTYISCTVDPETRRYRQ